MIANMQKQIQAKTNLCKVKYNDSLRNYKEELQMKSCKKEL